MNEIYLYCLNNPEIAIPVLLVVAEIAIRFIPTKDPAGLLERVGKILHIVFDKSRLPNKTKEK